QEAVRLRDEFLSIAAHELRTPLTALQLQLDGLDQTLRRAAAAGDNDLGRFRWGVDKAVRNATRLADLVNMLLDVSRLMDGRIELHLEEIDLALLVREVADDF